MSIGNYLGHKSCHPGSFQNIEKVWIQEEKQKELSKLGLEKAKNLKTERDNEAMKRLQVQAGLLPASALDRQEWIYDWGNKASLEQVKEEYLLGKPIADRSRDRDSRKYPFTPCLKEEYVNVKSEAFRKLHEDPMFMMRKEEMRLKKDILNNPVQMRKICKEVEEKEKEKSRDRKKSKKSKKEKNSKRKSSKYEREKSYSDKSSSISVSRSRSRSKSVVRNAKERPEKDSVNTDLFREYMKNKLGCNVKFDIKDFKADFHVNRKQRDNKKVVYQEDRSKMIEEMKKDAEDFMVKRDIKVKSFEDQEEKKGGNGNFIVEIRKEVYDKKEEITDLGDRMARNVHYYHKDVEGRMSLME